MYAVRLCEALSIDLEHGVVRVSLVHYNTIEEIERLILVFEEIL
jgi:selenocysteine lyase/cysteine desulfurase